MSTSIPPDNHQKTHQVSYTQGQVEAVIALMNQTFDKANVPVPLAILAMENIMDRIEASGFKFDRKPRGLFSV